jgi:hypothetical protein
MEITLIKRHGRALILAVLVAVTALLLFALMSAGGKRLATAQAAVHHTAHVASASDPAGNSQAGGPDTTNANDPVGGPENSQAGGPDTTNASDPAGGPENSRAGAPDTTNSNDAGGGNSQAGGPDTGGSSETTGDTETGAAEQSLPGGGANDNGTCDGNCVQ